jgi:hypothetical protein
MKRKAVAVAVGAPAKKTKKNVEDNDEEMTEADYKKV